MNKKILFLIIGLIISAAFFVKIHPAVAASITVTSPNGGESFQIGKQYTITWTSSDPQVTYIDLLSGTSPYMQITGGYSYAAGTNSFSWTVQPLTAPGNNYKVRIMNAAQTVIDTSDGSFSVTSIPAVTVTSPNSGGSITQGQSYVIWWNVNWMPSDSNNKVDIYYRRTDISQPNQLIVSGVTNQSSTYGYYYWSVPTTLAIGTYRIVVVAEGTNSINPLFDESDTDFNIVASSVTPTISLTSPNGAEQWLIGTSHNITWITSGAVANVSIILQDANNNLQTIVDNISNTGTYSWTPSSSLSAGQYKIRVSGTNYSSATGISANYFSLISQTLIAPTLVSPVNGATITSNYPSLQWSAVAGAKAYQYKILDASGNELQSWNTDYQYTSTQTVGTSLTNGNYQWKVRACSQLTGVATPSDSTCGPWSNIWQFTVLAEQTGITVISPNGGEQWQIGKTYQIKWSASASILVNNLVNILLYKGSNCSLNTTTGKQVCGYPISFSNTPPTALAVNVPNTGSYNWTVPSFLTPDSDYRIDIQNPDNLPYTDQSDAPFSIIAATTPSITVLSPNGGEQILQGSNNFVIKYNLTNVNLSNYQAPKLKLELLKDDVSLGSVGWNADYGDGYLPLYSDPQYWDLSWEPGLYFNNGSQTASAGNGYKIRASIYNGTQLLATDASDAPFSITNSSLTCNNYWWFDNTSRVCQQKSFCGAYMYYGLQTFTSSAECQAALTSGQVACTADAKLCPDGSYVSRVAPNCEFAACPATSIPEGGLIRAKGDIDVYIVKYINGKQFKRLILSPSVFNSYGHLKWSNVQDVDKSVVDSFTNSDLVRAVNDPKVYKLTPAGDTGQRQWIETSAVFTRMGFDWDSIYQINQVDRDSYTSGQAIE